MGKNGVDRTDRSALFLLLILALSVRMIVRLASPNLVHADEIFQYAEPAYRLVTGRGLVAWEYLYGMRSWAMPGMLLPVIAAVRQFGTSPQLMAVALMTFSAAISLTIVAGAYVLGQRTGLRSAALCAGLLAALWPEFVYMAPHILADTFAAAAIMAGLLHGYRPAVTPRAMAAAGAWLAFAVMLRPQLAPAVIVLAIGIVGCRHVNHYRALAFGGAVVTLGFGALDWMTWGVPFYSPVAYIYANAGGVASMFGRAPASFYVNFELQQWSWAAVLIVPTALLGARRMPLLAVAGMVVLLTFSLIGHKEYRFVYPALPFLFILAGVGTSEALNVIGIAAPRLARFRRIGLALFGMAWLAAMATTVASTIMRENLTRGRSTMTAIAVVDADRSVCGLAVEPEARWDRIGLVALRDDLTLYRPPSSAAVSAAPYNAVLVFGDVASPSVYRALGFTPPACFHDNPRDFVCLYRRPGGCAPDVSQRLRTPPDAKLVKILSQLGLRPR